MGVDQSGADLAACDVHHAIRRVADCAADGKDAVILDQYVAHSGLCTAAVHDHAVFEQGLHNQLSSSFPSEGYFCVLLYVFLVRPSIPRFFLFRPAGLAKKLSVD